jgi:antitoxin VapB
MRIGYIKVYTINERECDMRQIAKLFMNGRSQAVRLPSSFRFDCDTVYIRKDPETGDVILSRKPGTWDDFFELIDTLEIPRDFIGSRENEPANERHLF